MENNVKEGGGVYKCLCLLQSAASPPLRLPPHQKNLITLVSCQGSCNNPSTTTTHTPSLPRLHLPFPPSPDLITLRDLCPALLLLSLALLTFFF